VFIVGQRDWNHIQRVLLDCLFAVSGMQIYTYSVNKNCVG
jgi:hypothetical protein